MHFTQDGRILSVQGASKTRKKKAKIKSSVNLREKAAPKKQGLNTPVIFGECYAVFFFATFLNCDSRFWSISAFVHVVLWEREVKRSND